MADGRIVIDVVVNDGDFKKLNTSLDNIKGNTDGVTGSAKNMTLAFLGAKIISGIMDTIAGSLDSAISRFDTMRQYPKVMELVGFSTEQSERSVRKLAQGIEGLPTRLDEVVGTAQGLTMITDDINYATDLTLALNNAFLASGASGMDASRGLQQYSQMLANGKPDLQSWKTLQETMPVALKMTAEAFGYAGGRATRDFYEALLEGEITFEQFGDKLIEINGQVGGFADMALESSKGIATSFQNVKTAVINGLTMVLDALDNVSKEITGSSIAENLDKLKQVVKIAFRAIADAIETATPIIKLFYDAFSILINFILENTWILEGLVTAFLAFKIANKVKGYFDVIQGGLETLYLAFLEAKSGTSTFLGALEGSGGKIGGFVSTLTSVPGAIATFVGVTIGIVALAKKKWDEYVDELAAADREVVQNLTDSIQQMNDEVAESSENFETQKSKISMNTDSVKKLAGETFDLANKKGRTAAETKQLKLNIDDLNKALGDEILHFDEATNSINSTTEELLAYIEVLDARNLLELQSDRIVEIQNQLVDVTRQRTEAEEVYNTLLQEEADIKKQISEHTGESAEVDRIYHADRIKHLEAELACKQENLAAAEKEYNTISTLEKDLIAEQSQITADRLAQIDSLTTAEDDYTEAVQQNAEIRITTLDDLYEADRKYVEELQGNYQKIKAASTDMFSKINTESEQTAADMLATLKHNVQAVTDWANNLESLGNRTLSNGQKVSTGFLDYLRNLGPQGAAYVQELVTASDAELIEFSNIFDAAGDLAGTNLSKAWDIPKEELPAGVWELITSTEQGLTDGFNSIDWNKYAKTMGSGLTKGIDSQADSVKKSSEGMADEALSGLKTGLQSQSPSKKTETEGKNFGTGLVQGISSTITSVKAVVQQISTTIVITLKEGLENIYYIGQAAGQGFNNGLWSMSGSIINTANYIANSVSNTISRALQIRSPSKVTEKLGSSTGEGFAIGLGGWIDKINAIAGLFGASFLPKYSASGAVGMGLASQTVNNRTNMDNSMTLNVDTIVWQGESDIRQTMDEIGFISGQEKWRLEYV